MRRIDRLGGQHGQDLLAEMLVEPGAFVIGQRVDRKHVEIAFGEAFAQYQPLGLLRDDQRVGLLGDRRELLGRGQPVDRALLDSAQLLALQSSDPDHEEFVDVRARDRQEAQPLEQRVGLVLGLLQHPPVERQPRQFAIEEAFGAELRDGARGGRRRVGADNVLTRRHAARPSLSSPPSISARRITGILSRACSAMAKRSTAATIRSALQ